MKWSFKDDGYGWNKIVFELKDGDKNLSVTMIDTHHVYPKRKFTINDIYKKTWVMVMNEYDGYELGRHFESGLATVFHELHISQGLMVSILRDPVVKEGGTNNG